MSYESPIASALLLGIVIAFLAGMWKMYKKADEPGWAAIVPIYNMYVLLRIAGRPGWWLLLFFVPILNWVVPLLVYYDAAKNFGRGDAFAVASALFAFPLAYLGFSDDEYQPRDAEEVAFSDYYIK